MQIWSRKASSTSREIQIFRFCSSGKFEYSAKNKAETNLHNLFLIMLLGFAFVLLNHVLSFLNHLILSETHYSFNYSPNVNTLFSCFAGSPWGWGETFKAFIFSLKNSEGLPPFKCFAKNKDYAIYKSLAYGPSFGDYTGLEIIDIDNGARGEAKAMIFDPYSVPTEVKDKLKVLAGVAGTFSPDNYEVFYLV